MAAEPRPRKSKPTSPPDDVDTSLAATGEFPHEQDSQSAVRRKTVVAEQKKVDKQVKDQPFRQPKDSASDGAE